MVAVKAKLCPMILVW